MLTDRDERARVSAVEQRISEPLRFPALPAAVPAVAAAVRRILARRPRGSVQGRESVSCQPTPPPVPPR